MPDAIVSEQGSIVCIDPLTRRAKTWIKKHVHAESWQWAAGSLAVERRCAADIVEAMRDSGLRIE